MPLRNNGTKAILFDVYGTLISTGTGSLDATRAILARNGRDDISPKEFYARWKALHREHIDGLSAFVKEADIFSMDLARLYQEYGLRRDPGEDVTLMLDTLGKRQAFPEAKTVLEALSHRFLTVIASTTDTAPLLADLSRNGISLDYVFTSEGLEAYKPQPEFYEKILDHLGISAPEAVFVGDSLIDDVAGPQAVGIQACWVNRGGREQGEAAPDYVISDLTGLLPLFGMEEKINEK